MFSEAYIESRGNGVASARAAGYKGTYGVLNSVSMDNLQKPSILAYIQFLLKDSGLSDEGVDKELLWAIQQNASLSAKVQAIREYNNVKGRHAPEEHIITNKLTDEQIRRILEE